MTKLLGCLYDIIILSLVLKGLTRNHILVARNQWFKNHPFINQLILSDQLDHKFLIQVILLLFSGAFVHADTDSSIE